MNPTAEPSDRETARLAALHRYGVLDTPAEQVMPHLTGVRIFAGYAGWVAGQLEGEIRNGSWYVVDRLPGDVFSDEPGTLWRRVLRRQPGRLAFVGLYPDDEDYN